MAGLVLVLVEDLRNLCDRFIVAGVGAAENNENSDGVFIDVFTDEFGV